MKKVRVTSPAKWKQAGGKAGKLTHQEGLPGSPPCSPRLPATEVPARLGATSGAALACARSLGLLLAPEALPCTSVRGAKHLLCQPQGSLSWPFSPALISLSPVLPGLPWTC